MADNKEVTKEQRAEQTAYMLDEITRMLDKHIIFPSDEARDSVVLWIAHTYVFDTFSTTPRLSLRSKLPGSGKSMVLDMVGMLGYNTRKGLGLTPATMWRLLEHYKPTLILDEVDTVFGKNGSSSAHKDLRCVINGGHRRGEVVPRCSGAEDVKDFNVFGPIAMGGLGRLPATIATRSVEIEMVPYKGGDRKITEIDVDEMQDHVNRLKRLAESWSELGKKYLVKRPDAMPVSARKADVWRPLVSIGDMAGDDWSDRARKASVVMTTEADGKKTSANMQALIDMRRVMHGQEHMSTAEALRGLVTMNDGVWAADELDARALARYLSAFDIRSVNIREDGKVFKGFRADQFAEAWDQFEVADPCKADAELADA